MFFRSPKLLSTSALVSPLREVMKTSAADSRFSEMVAVALIVAKSKLSHVLDEAERKESIHHVISKIIQQRKALTTARSSSTRERVAGWLREARKDRQSARTKEVVSICLTRRREANETDRDEVWKLSRSGSPTDRDRSVCSRSVVVPVRTLQHGRDTISHFALRAGRSEEGLHAPSVADTRYSRRERASSETA